MATGYIDEEIETYFTDLERDKHKLSYLLIIREPNQFKKFTAIIDGPPNTPFEGGKFEIDFVIDEKIFPGKGSPDIKMNTTIYHPNISGRGEIVIDLITKDWSDEVTFI